MKNAQSSHYLQRVVMFHSMHIHFNHTQKSQNNYQGIKAQIIQTESRVKKNAMNSTNNIIFPPSIEDKIQNK